MFANVHGSEGHGWKNLHLYHAESPLGPWQEHARNPVVSSLAESRPAGSILRTSDGRLLRPAQDSSQLYGRAVVFEEIMELTTEAYRQSLVTTLGPEWMRRSTGTHTYNLTEHFEVVDARFRIPRRPTPWVWRFEQKPWMLKALFGSHQMIFDSHKVSG